MTILEKSRELLKQTQEAFSEVFGETTANDVLQAADQLLSYEIQKAENRKQFEGLDNDAVQEKLAKEKEEAILENQKAAAALLERPKKAEKQAKDAETTNLAPGKGKKKPPAKKK